MLYVKQNIFGFEVSLLVFWLAVWVSNPFVVCFYCKRLQIYYSVKTIPILSLNIHKSFTAPWNMGTLAALWVLTFSYWEWRMCSCISSLAFFLIGEAQVGDFTPCLTGSPNPCLAGAHLVGICVLGLMPFSQFGKLSYPMVVFSFYKGKCSQSWYLGTGKLSPTPECGPSTRGPRGSLSRCFRWPH